MPYFESHSELKNTTKALSGDFVQVGFLQPELHGEL